jgi:hypothetical protein
VRDGAAIAPCPTRSSELAAHDLPIFHWRHDARQSYSCATPCERFRSDRRAIHVGSSKAAGKFTKVKAYARCTAAKERAKMPSATRTNALVMRQQR